MKLSKSATSQLSKVVLLASRMIQVAGATDYEPWVWVAFRETPAPELRQILAQLGFHWNNTRQTWQHPCGTYRYERANYDPRRRYGSYFPADSRAT